MVLGMTIQRPGHASGRLNQVPAMVALPATGILHQAPSASPHSNLPPLVPEAVAQQFATPWEDGQRNRGNSPTGEAWFVGSLMPGVDGCAHGRMILVLECHEDVRVVVARCRVVLSGCANIRLRLILDCTGGPPRP